ncbi:SP_1767 family glycosyltransferase [Prevotella sp. HCN-7019]|uniref:SP_1767 family glycosyltransferase n=1 Tax=Prevotella sp. HCN-7019 TaxID=3134668 RepID=UPI0030BE5CC7
MSDFICRFDAYFQDHIVYPFIKKWILRNLKIKSTGETIEYILKNKCSVSRYGDGEFDMIQGGSRGFQDQNIDLAIRLKNILVSDDTLNHIVCIPYTLKCTNHLRDYAYYFWKSYTERNYKRLLPLLNLNKIYYDAMISRFYMDYKDKNECGNVINQLKEIWKDRDVIIVEGCYTISGIGNDLYAGVKSLRRIICPAENSYSKYDEIIEAVRVSATKNDLILICLGMTATVLAYDLANDGYQAIDMGHLDVEYEWYLHKVEKKVKLPNRYVNEVNGGNKVQRCNDPVYLSQIIAEII